MFLRGVFTKSKNCFTLQCKLISPRTLSSRTEVVPKTNETVPTQKQRRFVKPKTTRELKPFDENFVVNLFKGECSKEIFEYPLIFSRSELDSVISHSLDVEDFLNKNSNIEVKKDTLEDFKNVELFGLSIPQEYGGAGYSVTETKFLVECCAVNPNVARFIGYNDDVGSRLICQYGTEEQKQKYLPRLASGESRIALAYLETGPLIDFCGFEGSMIDDQERNGAVINAKKKWVHNAHVADLLLVLIKTTNIFEEDDEFSKLGFTFFIVEKSSPGVSVHQLVSGCSKDMNLFEVDFKNVFVPRENQLGSDFNLGQSKLQQVLSLRELTDAVICTSLIKRMIHSALHYCENKVINEMPLKNFDHIQISMACLSAYAYALESVVYLISARFDSHTEPNLFHEGILAKILAVEMLQLAIERYTQILGYDSLRKCEILDLALKTLHHSSVLDENNTYLKLIISTAGVMNIKPTVASMVRKLRKKYDYPVEAIKYSASLTPKKISKLDPKLGIKGELNQVIAAKGDVLEHCLGKLRIGIENHLVRFGATAIEDEFTLTKYAEMVTYVYALAACLSRASTAYCYDLKNSQEEINIAMLFADIAEAKFEQLANEAIFSTEFSEMYREVGKLSFAYKEYPAEHPLSRAY